jgi:GNAT superfamily N-acetyltransferase
MMPEKLDTTRRPEALAVLKQAFASHPMLPPGTPIDTTEALLGLMLDTFGRTDGACLHGIRRGGDLACVSLAVDPRREPKGLAMAGFFFRLFRILGWRLTMAFIRALARRPKYGEPYLDLVLLATLPAHHGQGMGREMLRFLYGLAEEQGYRGLTLAAAADTPAHRLYLAERFVVDCTVPVRGMALCHMRRDNGG